MKKWMNVLKGIMVGGLFAAILPFGVNAAESDKVISKETCPNSWDEFKYYDTDHDEVLSEEEILAVTKLDMRYGGFYYSSMDEISQFKNLEVLVIDDEDYEISPRPAQWDADFNCFPNLRELVCRRFSIKSLDVSQCAKLEKLDCGANPLNELNITFPTGETI